MRDLPFFSRHRISMCFRMPSHTRIESISFVPITMLLFQPLRLLKGLCLFSMVMISWRHQASALPALDPKLDVLRKSIPDLVNSPDWQPFYQHVLATQSLRDLLSPSSGNKKYDDHGYVRHHSRLQETAMNTTVPASANDIPCNQVLDTITLKDLKATMTDMINALIPGGSGVERYFLQSLLVDPLKSGIQVVQVCGSCATSIPESEQASHQEYCGNGIYGYDQEHSGLLLIPTTASGDAPTIVPGTHKGYIYTQGTRLSVEQFPSLLWLGRLDTNPILWFYMAMASLQQVVFLSPHTMGYGVSSSEYKAYIIRKGYETSTVPLWYQAQTLVSEWSYGCSALGNAAIVTGYSEGGYSSVVVAEALRRNAGVEIIRVQSGAGPYKVASEAMLGIAQGIDADKFPIEQGSAIFALLGVSYSSTYPNLANYNSKQLVLANDTIRDVLLESLMPGTDGEVTADDDAEYLWELIQSLIAPSTNVLDMFRADFVAAARENACVSLSTAALQELEMDLLCQALVDNDLTSLLETQVDYPVEFCQSPDDEIVVAGNLPNLTANPKYLSQVGGISGSHIAAGEACFLQVVQTAVLSAGELANYKIEDLHNTNNQSCGAVNVGGEPTAAPMDNNMLPPSSASSIASSVSSVCWCIMLVIGSIGVTGL